VLGCKAALKSKQATDLQKFGMKDSPSSIHRGIRLFVLTPTIASPRSPLSNCDAPSCTSLYDTRQNTAFAKVVNHCSANPRTLLHSTVT